MSNFICIGAQKAATSWVYQQLVDHPEILFPGGKEVHYWDWVQSGKRPADINWYRKKFAPRLGKILCDITPAYATLEPSWVSEIAEEFPNARILFILRNPIDRAWSAAKMAFECSQLEWTEVDISWFRTHLNSRASRSRGDYETTLRRWSDFFSSEQVKVMFYDDLVLDPGRFIAGIYEHVGVTNLASKLSSDRLRRRYNSGLDKALPDELRAELFEFYRPRIDSLSDYLRMDLSHWCK